MGLGKRQGLQENGREWYWKYFNSGGYATAIVEVITPGIDWAVYIGGGPVYYEHECIAQVASFGSKMSEEDGRHFFPQITLPYRR